MVTPLASYQLGSSAPCKSFLLMTNQPRHTNYSLLSRCMQFSLTYAWYRIHCSSSSASHHAIVYLFLNSCIQPMRMYVCLGDSVPLYKELIYKLTLFAPFHCRHTLLPAHHQPSCSQRQDMLHSRSSENNSLMKVLHARCIRLDVLAVA